MNSGRKELGTILVSHGAWRTEEPGPALAPHARERDCAGVRWSAAAMRRVSRRWARSVYHRILLTMAQAPIVGPDGIGLRHVTQPASGHSSGRFERRVSRR